VSKLKVALTDEEVTLIRAALAAYRIMLGKDATSQTQQWAQTQQRACRDLSVRLGEYQIGALQSSGKEGTK
jgi:hypothetical protein